MIEYINSTQSISPEMLNGFFVGWLNPPSALAHLSILDGSFCVWLAVDADAKKVVGFITAISDGVISAYIPLLEVLPEYQKNGIGKELVTRMLNSLKDLYMIDLLCNEELQRYYEKFGMRSATGAFIRNYHRQNCNLSEQEVPQ